jgi:hypothetical protein
VNLVASWKTRPCIYSARDRKLNDRTQASHKSHLELVERLIKENCSSASEMTPSAAAAEVRFMLFFFEISARTSISSVTPCHFFRRLQTFNRSRDRMKIMIKQTVHQVLYSNRRITGEYTGSLPSLLLLSLVSIAIFFSQKTRVRTPSTIVRSLLKLCTARSKRKTAPRIIKWTRRDTLKPDNNDVPLQV